MYALLLACSSLRARDSDIMCLPLPIAFSVASERLDISPSLLRVFKLIFALSSAMHIAACFFWRVKVRGRMASVADCDVETVRESELG